MKNNVFKFICILYACCLFFNCSDKKEKSVLPEPKIEAGIAKVKGKVIGLDENKDFSLAIAVYNPITIDHLEKEVSVNKNGEFSLDIPIETNPCIGLIKSSLSDDIFFINFSLGEETIFDYIIDEQTGVTLDIKGGPSFFVENNKYASELFLQALSAAKTSVFINKDSISRFINNPKELVPFLMEYDLKERLGVFQFDERISKQAKFYYENELKLLTAEMSFFNYVDKITNLYNAIKLEGDTAIVVEQPDRSYYSFLKEFRLGNPYYLYSYFYPTVLQLIIQDDNLKIPPINDTPVEEWLKEVKGILDDLIGKDTGIFYDVLISNAYARQLSYNQVPFSDKQIQNINEYFDNAEIAKILLRKNDELLKITETKGESIFNETPKVSKEVLLKTIIEKYKGKVVLVDLWATWCSPCLNAMKEMQPLKGELYGEDVVFVYITNPSSPSARWRERAKGIDGEHYYLTDIEWDYVMDDLGVSAIPTYLIFDKQGALKNKMTGYPGTSEMTRLLKEKLK